MSTEFQDACYSGEIQKCLDIFNPLFKMNVKMFDSYRAKAILEEMVDDEEFNRTLFFLCYWGEHVFPIKRESLESIVKENEKMKRYFSLEGR